MDFIVHSALEEVCSQGSAGLALQDLWPRLHSSVAAQGLAICPYVKAALWSNLLRIPGLEFEAQGVSYNSQQHSSVISSVETCEQMDLKIVASEPLRNNFVGIYDVEASNSSITQPQRRTLERLAIAGRSGITQSDLAKEYGVKGNSIFYNLKKLEARGLIVRQSTVVKRREIDGEGESKHSSAVTTNMLHLYRFAKHLGCQQKIEIIKEDKSLADPDIADGTDGSGVGFDEESVKEDIQVKDYIPAMKAICEKLEQAEGKVLTVSDIKRNLGYRSAQGHRNWRTILHRLKDAELVEEFLAKVKNKGVTCLRLLKKYSPKDFEPKSSRGDNDMYAEPLKRGQITEQLVELPVEHQVYDMIDAAGPKGLTIHEVCKRLGLRKKQHYDRLINMFYRLGMHLELESCNRGVAFRVWTSRNFNAEASDVVVDKLKPDLDEKTHCDPCPVDLEVNRNSAQSILEIDASASKDTAKSADAIEVGPDVSYMSTADEEGNNMLVSEDVPQQSASRPSGRVSDVEPDTISKTVATSELSPVASSKVSRHRLYHRLTLAAVSAKREQRILKMLEEEKFLIKPELHRRLENLENIEKEKNTIMDRKTLERNLNKLQQEGQCKCIILSVPVITNLGRSRTTEVILHPSIFTVTPQVLSQIHERMRSFEMEVRRLSSSRLNKGLSVPVLDDIQRISSHEKVENQAEQAEAMRTNGYVPAKIVRTKLLHIFLWGYVSSLPDWDDVLSLGKQGYDMKNPHSTCRLFELDAAIKSMPLEMFLQVAGSTKKFEDLVEKCRSSLHLSDLPLQEYKCLMDTRAMGRLSWLINVLQRLKLIRLVSTGHTDDADKLQHTTLTHALELKPYIEEPVSIVASSSGFLFPDLRPHIRHDFVLSTRKAVDEYWNTLEFCYSAANSRAALHAFPGSAVPEVFLARSWAAVVRVMSAYQRAQLLKRVANDDLDKKLSFKECKGIAEDLNLTLEQVLRVYYDKRRLVRYSRDSYAEDEEIRRAKSAYNRTSRKRKRSCERKPSKHVKIGTKQGQSSEEKLAEISETGGQSMEKGISFCEYEHNDTDDLMEVVDGQESNDENEGGSFLHKRALSRLKPRKRKFPWNEDSERQLVIEYVRFRAILGAKFHRVDWGSLPNLPAPPDACRRRMAMLNSSRKFRKAIMRLCNRLAERYAKHLEKFQNNLSNQTGKKVMVRELVMEEDYSQKFPDTFDQTNEFESEERWDNFDDNGTKAALDDVLRCKMTAKLEAKRVDSDEWANECGTHHSEMDPSTSQSQHSTIFAGRSKLTARRSRSPFSQSYDRLLNQGTGLSRKAYESVAVSNAVELFKLIFLSTSKSSQASAVLAETLRRYSQHDLFAAFSYLREKKIMIGGNGTSPFVLSHLFLGNISLSPFPTNTGKRASKFSCWLDERGKDLMEEEVYLPADLQSGETFHLCALVSRGELSLTPHLPDEGVGEAEDSRNSKRKSSNSDVCDGENAKRMRKSFLNDGEIICRREKGFPGISLSLSRVTLPGIHALEFFKDEDSHSTRLPCAMDNVDNTLDPTVARISSCFDECNGSEDNIDSGDIIQSAVAENKSTWEIMASYAGHLYDGKGKFSFDPELFENICVKIQKSGDQGLSMKEISEVLNVPGDEELEIVVEVLEKFGRALKVHAFDSIHVVDSLYQTKYFISSKMGNEQNPEIAFVVDSEGKFSDEHLLSNTQHSKIDVAGPNETNMDNDEMHRVTILNHPKEVAERSNEIRRSEVEGHLHSESISVKSIPRGELFEFRSIDSHICSRILPWMNGDGTVNQLVYKGLVRRLLGVVMQNPGMIEDDIIRQMHALNPQSCRKLLEIMILENHIIVRRMQQTGTSTQPPAILGSLFRSPIKKPEVICKEHFFANPMSTSLL